MTQTHIFWILIRSVSVEEDFHELSSDISTGCSVHFVNTKNHEEKLSRNYITNQLNHGATRNISSVQVRSNDADITDCRPAEFPVFHIVAHTLDGIEFL